MNTPLLQNILDQPDALRAVAAFQFGAGREALEHAAGLLRTRKRIVLSGMGASCFACIPLQHRLAQRTLNATCVETAELLYFLSQSIQEDSAVVLVSRSGESIEVTKLLEGLLHSSAAVLGIVNIPDSTLGRHAHRTLLLNSPADQLVAIQTYTATLAVFALLEAAMFGELEQARAELDKTISLLHQHIPQWVAAREQWRNFLTGDRPLYILGRGSAMGAVAEGVLLMHETAKSSAVGMSAPQFRHGPVEVVDRHFRTVIIGTQTQTSELDSALAKDLTAMGGQVCWVGPAFDGGAQQRYLPWPDSIPARFASILETIPLQILAYLKAEILGLRPGDFRWAPAVTSSESGFPGPLHG